MYLTVVKIAAIAAAPLLLILLFIPRLSRHKMVLRAYFTNAMGLRTGAPVRLAGVDIGSVKSVQAMPERKQFPVEVVMLVNPPVRPQDPLTIPWQLWKPQVFWGKRMSISMPPLLLGRRLETVEPLRRLRLCR